MDRTTVDRVRVSAGLAPGSWPAQLRLARVLRRASGPWSAETRWAVARAIELAPAEPRTHFLAGLLALERSEHRPAAAAFRRVCELRPDTVAGLTNQAIALMRGPGILPRHYDPGWPVTLGQADELQIRLRLAGRLAAIVGFIGTLMVGLAATRTPDRLVVLLVEISLMGVVAVRVLWSRTLREHWRLLPRMWRHDRWFAVDVVLSTAPAMLFAVAGGLALAGGETFALAAVLGLAAMGAWPLVDWLRWPIAMAVLPGPLVRPVSLLLAALRRVSSAPRAQVALDVALWRMLARLWLPLMGACVALVWVQIAAPATVTRVAAVLLTVAAAAAWSRVLHQIARPAARHVGWLVRHDPLLLVVLGGMLASALGWAGLAVSAGTTAASFVIAGAMMTLLGSAGVYWLRMLQASGIRMLHRLGIRPAWPAWYPPHPGALVPHERLERR